MHALQASGVTVPKVHALCMRSRAHDVGRNPAGEPQL